MCRSSAQGGRRCAGRGASTAAPTITLIDETQQMPREGLLAAAAEVRVLEERDRVDELARQLPADRKGWDGSPLNEKDRRFFALRDSGYTGPIDQDGYPDTTSESADTLRYIATQRGESVDW